MGFMFLSAYVIFWKWYFNSLSNLGIFEDFTLSNDNNAFQLYRN